MSQLAYLRTELCEEDLLRLIRWMSNEHVYRFLNEHQQITAQLKQIYDARLLCSPRCSTGTADLP